MRIPLLAAQFLLASFLFLTLPIISRAQDEKQNNFQKMRNTDFTKLIGGIQEGVRLNYNSEKTNIEGSGGKEIKKAHLLLQGVGSVGTTTNLSTIFSQQALPTFSATITIHYLFPNLSKWFYDGTFSQNYTHLKDPAVDANTLDTKTDPSEKVIFKYKQDLKEKIQNGTLKSTDNLYTFKQFCWVSFSTKYDNSKYSFFDGTRAFSDQLYEPSYNSWTGKFSLNGYLFWNKADVKWKKFGWRPNFIYLTLSAQYGLGNNVQQLKKTTINDISSITVNGETRGAYAFLTSLFKVLNILLPFWHPLLPLLYLYQ